MIAQHLLGKRKGLCVSLVLVGKGPIGRDEANSGHEHDLVGRDKAGGCTSSVQAIVRSSPGTGAGTTLFRQANATQDFDAARTSRHECCG